MATLSTVVDPPPASAIVNDATQESSRTEPEQLRTPDCLRSIPQRSGPATLLISTSTPASVVGNGPTMRGWKYRALDARRDTLRRDVSQSSGEIPGWYPAAFTILDAVNDGPGVRTVKLNV